MIASFYVIIYDDAGSFPSSVMMHLLLYDSMEVLAFLAVFLLGLIYSVSKYSIQQITPARIKSIIDIGIIYRLFKKILRRSRPIVFSEFNTKIRNWLYSEIGKGQLIYVYSSLCVLIILSDTQHSPSKIQKKLKISSNKKKKYIEKSS